MRLPGGACNSSSNIFRGAALEEHQHPQQMVLESTHWKMVSVNKTIPKTRCNERRHAKESGKDASVAATCRVNGLASDRRG